jgi:hypothetical protein
MFEVKCSNCETVTKFNCESNEYGSVITTDDKDIEIGYYNGGSGWFIKCNVCKTEIEEC